jgi:hypothetical protein
MSSARPVREPTDTCRELIRVAAAPFLALLTLTFSVLSQRRNSQASHGCSLAVLTPSMKPVESVARLPSASGTGSGATPTSR